MAEHECSLCGTTVPEESFYAHRRMEKAIIDLIKKKNPQWVETDGSCARCFEYYRTLAEEGSGDESAE
jgi:hypothetical protein